MGMRLLAIIVTASLVFPLPIMACTYVYLEHGLEVQPNLMVGVTFGGTALPGATVTLMSLEGAPSITMTTASDGTVRVNNLRPGQYLIDIRLHEVIAASEQIEVRSRPSSAAKARLDYRWGTSPTAVRRAVGTVVGTRAWLGIDILKNIVSPMEAPMVGVRIELTHLRAAASFATATDDRGEFAFNDVPSGFYVMRTQSSPNEYGSSWQYGSFLIEVRPDAKQEIIKLRQSHMCGDHLELLHN